MRMAILHRSMVRASHHSATNNDTPGVPAKSPKIWESQRLRQRGFIVQNIFRSHLWLSQIFGDFLHLITSPTNNDTPCRGNMNRIVTAPFSRGNVAGASASLASFDAS